MEEKTLHKHMQGLILLCVMCCDPTVHLRHCSYCSFAGLVCAATLVRHTANRPATELPYQLLTKTFYNYYFFFLLHSSPCQNMRLSGTPSERVGSTTTQQTTASLSGVHKHFRSTCGACVHLWPLTLYFSFLFLSFSLLPPTQYGTVCILFLLAPSLV